MDSQNVQHDAGYERRKAAFKREYIKKKRRKRMLHNAIVIAIRLLAAVIVLILCIKVIDVLFPTVSQTSKKQETNKTASDPDTKDDASKNKEESKKEALESKSDIDPFVLVNSKHKLSKETAPKLVEIYHTIFVDKSVAEAITGLIDAANSEGYPLYVASGYHTSDRQQVLYDAKINEYIAEGSSKEEAEEKAKKEVLPPGFSEYQTGLAVDITSSDLEEDSSFDGSDAAAWLEKHCMEYGFILRYPKHKEDVTMMAYSPIHYRYVGKEAAKEIMEKKIALEEYNK